MEPEVTVAGTEVGHKPGQPVTGGDGPEGASAGMESPAGRVPARWRRGAVIAAAAVAIMAGVAVIVTNSGSSSTATSGAAPGSTSVATAAFSPLLHQPLRTDLPPWSIPIDSRLFILAAGLRVLSREQPTVHYEAHLDITVDGSAVRVPSGIGFVTQNDHEVGVSVLHAHNASGVIHVESPTALPFTLGQFVTECGVRLGPGQLGGLVDGHGETLRTYVNGRAFTGDPATIVLASHQEIVLWFGPVTATPHVTDSYRFPSDD